MSGKLLSELSVGTKRNYLTKAQKSSDELMDKGNSLLNKGDKKAGVKALYKSGKRQETVNKTRDTVKGKGLSVVKEDEMKNIKETVEVTDLLQHAINKQPIEFYEVMDKLLAQRIEPILVDAKQELAKDLFKYEDDVTEAKKIGEYTHGNKTAKVYSKNEDGEHVVKLHINGKHHPKSDYFTDNHEDAHGTAKRMVKEEKGEDEPSDSKNNEKNKRDNRFVLKKKFKNKQSKKDRDWD